MRDFLLGHWPAIAMFLYVGGFLAFALLELALPRRDWSVSTLVRWTNNLASFATGAGLAYLCLPALTVGFAILAEARGWGLLNYLGWSNAWAVALCVVFIDLARYLEHRLLHGIPVLWRLHRMHHADPDYDVTTGLRAHPFEVLFSSVFRMAVIATLGLPVVAVMIGEILIVVMNFFIHANLRIPVVLDEVIRRLLITPDLHRIHHSTEYEENNSNFSNIFSFWDRWFGTYCSQPKNGHVGMTIGLEGFLDPKHMLLPWMLVNPWLSGDGPRTRTGPEPSEVPLGERPG